MKKYLVQIKSLLIILLLPLFLPCVTKGTNLHNQAPPPFSDSQAGEAFSLTDPVTLGGGLCQTVFWPSNYLDADDAQLSWLGEVFGLLQDKTGTTYEDSNRNRTLDALQDKPIRIFKNNGELAGCYGDIDASGSCNGTVKPFEQIDFLWSASSRLNNIPLTEIISNRSDINSPGDTRYISASSRRNIFTWNDLDNDGIVDQQSEVLPFEAGWGGHATDTKVGDTNRGSRNPNISEDFGMATQNAMDRLIHWIRGMDQEGFRSRTFSGDDGPHITWRLGDNINSTPVLVGKPAENYHLLYKDESYASFVAHYRNRRQVAYFGANDGMLHAINAGFYTESSHKFCLTENCQSEASAPPLGTELWAYIPYNLAPHIQCLAAPNYEHEFFVDLKPKAFDVRIFDEDQDHPAGWGTILVCGMGFGGHPVSAESVDLAANGIADAPNDHRVFSSSYFIFDITNPEKPPLLLGEMTHLDNITVDAREAAQVGYTIGSPAIVPVVSDAATNDSDWYLVFGNGPDDQTGTNTQKPTLFIMPLDWLAGIGGFDRELRFPLYNLTEPNTSLPCDDGAAYTLPTSNHGYIGDPATVDFELLPNYKANVVYFGSTEHHAFDPDHPSSTPGNLAGKMYRLIIGDQNHSGGQVSQAPTTPDNWYINVLLDTQQPISQPVTVGWDKENYWVFFGTGQRARPDCQESFSGRHSFYGLKEPMERNFLTIDSEYGELSYCAKYFTWANIDKDAFSPNAGPGRAGLLNVTPITISWNSILLSSTVNNSGLADGNYQNLIDTISGVKRGCNITSHGLDGWYRDFIGKYEHPIGPANLLGGLLTFTTFTPHRDCFTNGESTFYALYYQTGVAWKKPTFQYTDTEETIILEEKMSLGDGAASAPKIQVENRNQRRRSTRRNEKKAGDKIIIQKSTGEIFKKNLVDFPINNYTTGRQSWYEGIPKTPAD